MRAGRASLRRGQGRYRHRPRAYSQGELERLTRRYTTEILPLIGPEQDIPAPDIGTDENTMAWMMDTFSVSKGYTVPGVVTGKPVSLGGSLGRRLATSLGVFHTARYAMEQQESASRAPRPPYRALARSARTPPASSTKREWSCSP